ncbi:plasmid transfer protein [Mucilaginibacter sp. FT3.2]|uniref:plasmid transfer protein n=1 Tax=Mucilaginibacter sp. FT3.2 TaxID=2723090 RepID=UPI001607DFC5|nr:plasmid transfer protein [Mucilaginibacter sp. FT3.2]MBB6234272.1 hypothetical protein [Mucilaginibacter sp. FT3.2]
MAKRFAVYKGLQKPLVFRGFKGKFIYWGLGSVLAGLVLGALAMSLINMYFGAMVLIGCIVGGLFITAGKQKGGLHSKTRAQGIFVHQLHLKKINQYARETNI